MSAAPPGSAHRWMKDGAQVKLAQTKIPRVGIVSHLLCFEPQIRLKGVIVRFADRVNRQ
jgi:hypothetical protein